MSTILFPSPIFGPVHSRRLGVSLGVNLLPADGKLCSFDCIYCECGLNGQHRPELRMPTREAVREALRAKLESMKAEGVLPDTITFSGNGEPTSHPDFEGIIDDTLALRDEYAPKSQVSVLTNATHIVRNGVFRALLRVDNALLKLDTVDEDYIHLVDRPTSRYDLPKLIERMTHLVDKLEMGLRQTYRDAVMARELPADFNADAHANLVINWVLGRWLRFVMTGFKVRPNGVSPVAMAPFFI